MKRCPTCIHRTIIAFTLCLLCCGPAPTRAQDRPQSPAPSVLAKAYYRPVPQIPMKYRGLGKRRVKARFDVNEDGSTGVTLLSSSGIPAVDRAVLDALRAWRWNPALLQDGTPVSSSAVVRIDVEVK